MTSGLVFHYDFRNTDSFNRFLKLNDIPRFYKSVNYFTSQDIDGSISDYHWDNIYIGLLSSERGDKMNIFEMYLREALTTNHQNLVFLDGFLLLSEIYENYPISYLDFITSEYGYDEYNIFGESITFTKYRENIF